MNHLFWVPPFSGTPHVSLLPSLSGQLMEAPAPFAPLGAEAPVLPRPSERCQRCGSLFPSDANFCSRCGLARSTEGQSYQHPEKLLGFAVHFPDNQKKRKIVMPQMIFDRNFLILCYQIISNPHEKIRPSERADFRLVLVLVKQMPGSCPAPLSAMSSARAPARHICPKRLQGRRQGRRQGHQGFNRIAWRSR